MAQLTIDRRQLLKIGISSGVLAAMPFGSLVLADEVQDKLLEPAGDSDLPIDAGRTGRLSRENFDTLSTLCTYVDETWELAAKLDPYFVRLSDDLNFKTREEPSYLTEYERAVELINLVVPASESAKEAWTLLLFSEFDVDNFAHTRLGRARNFVFSEIITHQIPMSGGFKSFGLWNYRGYQGGLFTMPGSYRRGSV